MGKFQYIYSVTTLSSKEQRVVSNKLNRQFRQGIPGKVLLSDITYIKYGASKTAYLSVIKDASSSEILAHHASDRITLDIATMTIEKLMKKHNLGQSMSRRSNCWDNVLQLTAVGPNTY